MPPTPYPPELIEAAEKEYPEDSYEDAGKRAAYLKGLSLAMPLVGALK